MLLVDNFGVKSISKFAWGLEAYIKNVYEFRWPMYTDLGRPLNSPKYTFVLPFGSCMKNWVSNCFPLLYICLHCDEGCIWWHFGAPGTPGFYVRAQHDPEFFFYFKTRKVCIIIISRIYMKNVLSIVFLCCTYISSVMRSSWHFSTSVSTYGPQDPQKLKRS